MRDVKIWNEDHDKKINLDALTVAIYKAQKDAYDGKDSLAQEIYIVIDQALQDLKSAAAQLVEENEWIRRKCLSIAEAVEEGRMVNSLGEYQQTAPAVDRLCGEYSQNIEVLYRMLRLGAKLCQNRASWTHIEAEI